MRTDLEGIANLYNKRAFSPQHKKKNDICFLLQVGKKAFISSSSTFCVIISCFSGDEKYLMASVRCVWMTDTFFILP